MRSLFRNTIRLLFWPAVVVLALNIETLAQRVGLDKVLAENATPAFDFIWAILTAGWFQTIALVLAGAGAALWIDSLLRGQEAPASASPTPEQLGLAKALMDYDSEKVDPWADSHTETYIELLINLEEWRAESVKESNIFDVVVNRVDGKAGEYLDIVVVFQKWDFVRDVGITCSNRKDGYETRVKKLTERHAIISISGIEAPCAIKLEFN